MSKLDIFTTTLDAKSASHLLRRATFGPTQSEIALLTGKTPEQAVNLLFSNTSYVASPPQPVEMDGSRSDAGQQFLNKPFSSARVLQYNSYVKYWWVGQMTAQTGKPSVLDKLTAFWQNHFVTSFVSVGDYRFTYKYISFLRANALGSFRDLVIGITKDPSMLIFQDGNKNEKKRPNENYGRELQELFTVGAKSFYGESNYTEEDVKAAARVLTGWQVSNYKIAGSTSFEVSFNADRHDTADKVFSPKYNNTIIAGASGTGAGDQELNALVAMLLQHPETPKFICRKLYRWYVNPVVTDEIENEVIIPLAEFFASSANGYRVEPVLKKLLTSQIFFDQRNLGAIVKSPAEFMIGMVRFFDQPVPDMTTDYAAFYKLMDFICDNMNMQQLNFLNQPSVFGSLPYYQSGYSKNWINETTLGMRGARTDGFVFPSLTIKPGYVLGIDVIGRLTAIQPDFSNVTGSPSITCEQVLAEFSKNLFATDLAQSQKDFLIDKIMMMNSSPRTTWIKEWDSYRQLPTDNSRKNAILWRTRALLKDMLRMAEYQLF